MREATHGVSITRSEKFFPKFLEKECASTPAIILLEYSKISSASVYKIKSTLP